VRRWGADQWAKPFITIVGDGISDTADHAISMAFGQSRRNYVRIQSNGFTDKSVVDTDDPSEANVKMLLNFADSMLKQKGMESVPFGVKQKLSLSNAERLEWFADELVCEHRSRLSRPIPTVVLKQATRSH